MSPLFSIVIPTYNRADRIVIALNSVLRQTFLDFEIIVVDDGSTDQTETVVAQFPDRRLRYFKKKNEERSIARNFGIGKATGQYINFLDSDDLFYPDHLATAAELIRRAGDPDVAHLGYQTIAEDGAVLLKRSDLDERIQERMIHENIMHCNAIFIKREIAIANPFPNSRHAIVSEDWYVFLKLVSRYPIAIDNTITSAIVEHAERSLRHIDPDKLIASTECIVEGLKSDPAFRYVYRSRVNYFFANQYTLVGLALALTKRRRKQMVHYLGIAIRYDATVIFRRRFLACLKYWL